MGFNGNKVVGLLLVLGALQFILAVIIAQSLYPNYSDRQVLSALGAGVTANIFNYSVMLLGVCILISAYLLRSYVDARIFALSMAMAGLGTFGVGFFPGAISPVMHSISAHLAFIFGPFAAILYATQSKFPQNMLYFLLGGGSIFMLILAYMGISFGLGLGGVERLIVYPIIVWELIFGAELLTL